MPSADLEQNLGKYWQKVLVGGWPLYLVESGSHLPTNERARNVSFLIQHICE
jgi:hypothetical protein